MSWQSGHRSLYRCWINLPAVYVRTSHLCSLLSLLPLILVVAHSPSICCHLCKTVPLFCMLSLFSAPLVHASLCNSTLLLCTHTHKCTYIHSLGHDSLPSFPLSNYCQRGMGLVVVCSIYIHTIFVYFCAINAWCCKEGVLLELSPLFLFHPCRHTSAGMGDLQIDNSLKCTYVT